MESRFSPLVSGLLDEIERRTKTRRYQIRRPVADWPEEKLIE